MDCLILHLSGPLQSWGTGAGRFRSRDTAAAPTKSALIGLIAACEGRPRGANVADLAASVVATRSDRPGIAIRDYHTTGAMGRHAKARLRTAEGKNRSDAILTNRWYLADAAFTAALGGPPDLIASLHHSLANPRFAPYLGRRCCLPDVGLVAGTLAGTTPWDALTEQVPLVRRANRRARDHAGRASSDSIRVIGDDPSGVLTNVNDAVHGFLDRGYGRRPVRDEVVDLSHLPTVSDSLELREFVEGAMTGA